MSDDLISRAKAIRWIKTECNPYGKPTLDYDTSCRIMEHLKRMPSAEHRWTPVTERMPEKLGDYLITATGERLGKKYICVEIGQWLGDAFWIGWYEPNKKILAWMPLPEPWKGADND